MIMVCVCVCACTALRGGEIRLCELDQHRSGKGPRLPPRPAHEPKHRLSVQGGRRRYRPLVSLHVKSSPPGNEEGVLKAARNKGGEFVPAWIPTHAHVPYFLFLIFFFVFVLFG